MKQFYIIIISKSTDTQYFFIENYIFPIPANSRSFNNITSIQSLESHLPWSILHSKFLNHSYSVESPVYMEKWESEEGTEQKPNSVFSSRNFARAFFSPGRAAVTPARLDLKLACAYV